MSQYKVVLTETDAGRNDHANHLRRRAKGMRRAKALGITVISITEIPGYYYIDEWIMDDPAGSNIYVFCWWCNAQGFVTTPGPVRVFTEQEASTLVDSYTKFSEIAKKTGDF